MARSRILLDVDGVLADFLTPAIVILRRLTGKPWTHQDMPTWDLFDVVGHEWEKRFFQECGRRGFAESLDVYAGAREGVAQLQQISDIYIVTSPMQHNPTWTYERESWLQKHFEIPASKVVHTSAKYLCRGDILVDDRPANVEKWIAQHPNGIGLLWDQPYNRSQTHLRRASSWQQVLDVAQNMPV
jgi:5'(3')-deoxyribonucleotidase